MNESKVVLVTSDDERVANRGSGECFYCNQAIGTEHTWECVTVKRRVKLRMTVEYEVDVPRSWDKDIIESHRNDGSWCANNAIEELRGLSERYGCICVDTNFEYLGES